MQTKAKVATQNKSRKEHVKDTDAGGGLLSTDPFWVRNAVPSDNNLTVFCPGFERCAFPCESERLS
jgi:hypothetical protein